MGVLHRLGDLLDQVGRLARRQRAVGDLCGQAAALDEAHAEVVLALVLADLVDGDDARMVEVGGGLGLDVEPLARRPRRRGCPARIILSATGRLRLTCRAL